MSGEEGNHQRNLHDGMGVLHASSSGVENPRTEAEGHFRSQGGTIDYHTHENSELKEKIASMESRIKALEDSDNDISLREVARVFESACALRFCREHFIPLLTTDNDTLPHKQRVGATAIASQAKNKAKNDYYNFSMIEEDSGLKAAWVAWKTSNGLTPAVLALLRRLKCIGDDTAHLRPHLPPAELEAMLVDDGDTEGQIATKTAFVALLTGFLSRAMSCSI